MEMDFVPESKAQRLVIGTGIANMFLDLEGK
jgi:hypothetical protein